VTVDPGAGVEEPGGVPGVTVDPGAAVEEPGCTGATPGSAEAPWDVSVDPHASGTEDGPEAIRQRVPVGALGTFIEPPLSVCPVVSP